MQSGYTILDVKKLKLSDVELIVKSLEQKPVKKEEKVIESTLDKAFPFLFGG
ncbi:hypothetical protein BOVMAS18_19100 [Streptococcus uberis]|uniref:hypothetical protein n=1 Tax=Streptococcus uberis TaxID=1349 RepID=UPI00062288E3|nr:hypothetical protein [Streptococcus uberis]KKF45915.1 hypothetical protein AF59_00605 [Streptococcus uberis C5072]QBX31202.1 hypothetical protein Javan626_0014 [Streptococcus phage Javan626]MCK1213817.1 hypothetical protein [Streptococcus uberis]MCK1222651.1 hypothetical protein [Streptococcus uberis]MCK1242371.1 hypothetical protein [Streptococcus uberis]